MSTGTRRLALAAALLVVFLVIGYAAMDHLRSAPTDLDTSLAKATEKGIYQVAISPEKEPVEQGPLHAWIVTLTTPDGKPVENARISVDGGMPGHGHGLPTRPEATDHLGDGRYRIDGVKFNMSGWWELKLAISASAGDDSVVFNLTL